MTDDRLPGYDAVIPARVLYDRELKDKAKLLYGVIRALASRDGYCWASNAYLCETLGISKSCLSDHLKALATQGHIYGEVITDADTRQVLERRIWVDRGKYLSRDPDLPPPDFRDTPIPDFRDTPIPDPREEKIIRDKKKTSKEDPPVVPPGGQAPEQKTRRRRKTPRDAPDWKPERFAGFWTLYPVKKAKQKTMDAWDRLKLSDVTLDFIARKLPLQMASEEWRRGVGIPHPATYLNQARWTDELELTTSAAPAGGWAEDPEVM